MAREFADHCPACGIKWSETLDDGRTSYPLLGGNVVNDRVASWHCLACDASWPRGSQTILKDADDPRPER